MEREKVLGTEREIVRRDNIVNGDEIIGGGRKLKLGKRWKS
jgi:hypothetical protein